MTISLHEASVGTSVRVLEAMQGILAKGAEHCAAAGIDPAEIVATRLYPDMGSFRFQVVSVCHHALDDARSVISGDYTVPAERMRPDYDDLRAMVDKALDGVRAIGPEEMEGRDGKEVVFTFNEAVRRFTAESFVLTYMVPNLHFHACTAYDILRMKGVPVGKRDFLGKPAWT